MASDERTRALWATEGGWKGDESGENWDGAATGGPVWGADGFMVVRLRWFGTVGRPVVTMKEGGKKPTGDESSTNPLFSHHVTAFFQVNSDFT